MHSVDIFTNGQIYCNGIHSGFFVTQTDYGTQLSRWARPIRNNNSIACYLTIPLPHKRYFLCCDKPDCGTPGKTAFDKDFRVIFEAYMREQDIRDITVPLLYEPAIPDSVLNAPLATKSIKPTKSIKSTTK
jgi:hypothetical protein